MSKDFFKDLDSQINLINSCLKEGKELPNFNSNNVPGLLQEYMTEEEDEDVYTIVKKARKVDFNQISYAQESYLQMMEMNRRYGMKVQYVPDYRYNVEELNGKSISELIKENKERDSYWVVDFTKELIITIKKEIEADSTFRYVDGQCVKVNKVTPKSIRKFVKRLMCFKNDADKEFLNLLDDVLEYDFDKECVGEQIIIEESLKKDLLGEDYDSLKENFEFPIDELIEYNIYHCFNTMYAKKILNAVKLLVKEGYTPKDIELKVEDDWEYKINSYLNEDYFVEDEEFGYTSLSKIIEEEDKKMFNYIKNESKENAKIEKAKIVAENAKQSITIQCVETGEIIEFNTKGECMRYLGCASQKFSQFIKGKSKLNKKYIIL